MMLLRVQSQYGKRKKSSENRETGKQKSREKQKAKQKAKQKKHRKTQENAEKQKQASREKRRSKEAKKSREAGNQKSKTEKKESPQKKLPRKSSLVSCALILKLGQVLSAHCFLLYNPLCAHLEPQDRRWCTPQVPVRMILTTCLYMEYALLTPP